MNAAAKPAPIASPPDETPLRDALAWTTGDSKSAQDPEKNVFVWLWEAVQGDFNDNRSTSQIAFDAAISMIPLVDQVCDIRDLISNCRAIASAEEDEDTTWKWIALGLTLIGLFPSLGSLVKGVLKIFFLFVRRHGLDHIGKATDQAMTWVIVLLRKREVQKYLPTKHIDEIFGWLAQEVRALRGKVNIGPILQAFDSVIGTMRSLLEKVTWLPGGVGERAQKAIDMAQSIRNIADGGLRKALKPVQDILDAIAKRLELERLVTRSGIVDTRNVHFRGGLPEANAVTLMQKANPKPWWLSRGRKETWVAADPKDYMDDIVHPAIKEGYPSIGPNDIVKFHSLEKAEISGPAKLYRITAPSNGAAGDFWISEEVFHQLQQQADPKAAWRKHLAVWPDWNPNGQFVVMEIPQGQSLKIWRGPTSSQLKPKKIGLDAHLEGGWEQILMKPSGPEWDSTRYFRRDSKGALVEPGLSRNEWASLPETEKSNLVPLREKINDPRIKGPYDTGWGTTDFDAQLNDVKIGIPALPGQITNR
jgi:hypothetical protein